MLAPSHLLSLPNELTSEIISYLAVSSSASGSSPALAQSHWDAFSHYKLTPSSCHDLQNLALAHTHLLEPCRSLLFRALRVYPAMPPARVTALIDLFLRAPKLVQHLKALWWTIGVEEYKATASYQWFKYPSEEREVRKAKDRLELVEALTQRDGLPDCGLRKVWITGCESQRKFDDSQRTMSSPFAIGGPMDDGSRVIKALSCLLSVPTVGYISLANVACPREAFSGSVGLEELRLGEGVTVFGSEIATAAQAVDAKREMQTPSRLRVLYLSSGLASESAVFEGEQEESSTPLLDLSLLQSLSCEYPSPAFSSALQSIEPDNLKSLSLQGKA